MAKKKQGKDWKHIVLFAVNGLTLALLIVVLLMYVLPTYKNSVIQETGPVIYRQCQIDTARLIVEDLNTKGFTQLTIGDQVVKLRPER